MTRLPRLLWSDAPAVQSIGKPISDSTHVGLSEPPHPPACHAASVSVSPMFAGLAVGLRFAVRFREPTESCAVAVGHCGSLTACRPSSPFIDTFASAHAPPLPSRPLGLPPAA